MRFLFSIVLCTIFSVCNSLAQEIGKIQIPFDSINKCYYYSTIETFEAPISDSLLYGNIKQFISSKFGNTFNIEVPNKEFKTSGHINFTYNVPIGLGKKSKSITVPSIVTFDIDIQFKSNRYKTYINNLMVTTNSNGFGNEVPLHVMLKSNIEIIDASTDMGTLGALTTMGVSSLARRKALEMAQQNNAKIAQSIDNEIKKLLSEIKSNAIITTNIQNEDW